jgi:hypothetical protein
MKFRNGSVGFEFLKSFDLCCYFCDVLIFEGDAFLGDAFRSRWGCERARLEGIDLFRLYGFLSSISTQDVDCGAGTTFNRANELPPFCFFE